jgi:hypothetical protein
MRLEILWLSKLRCILVTLWSSLKGGGIALRDCKVLGLALGDGFVECCMDLRHDKDA